MLDITVPRIVVGGVTSGVGKTTFVCGLVGALARRGLRVAPFKVGPDYIDPGYHSRMAGVPCRNLDSWMVRPSALLELFARATADADVAVVEGVMGLFDGRNGLDDEGSTSQIAKLLAAPVLLIVPAAKTSRSAGAMVLGYRDFDPELRLGGVVLNQVGSANHRRWVTESIEGRTGVPVVGHLPRRADLVLPERHLGLVPTAETAPDDAFFDSLVQQIEATVDLERVLDLARSSPPVSVEPSGLFPGAPRPKVARLGVAMDRAFNFYYQDSLDLLDAWGAELVPFSPLDDGALPSGLDGLYIGGGFPELFAAELARNRGMLESVRRVVEEGLPTYAECGGLMYLSEGITDFEGARHEMVGVVPAWSAMPKRRLTLGYRTATVLKDSPLLAAGETVRGHEFHWSELQTPLPPDTAAYSFAETGASLDGYCRDNLLATYLHLHMATRPDLPRRFVEACAAWRERRQLRGSSTKGEGESLIPGGRAPEPRGESPIPSPSGRGLG